MRSLLKHTALVLATIILLSPSFAQSASDDDNSFRQKMDKCIDEWYLAYTQRDKSEYYLDMARLAYQDLAQGEKDNKIGTKRYLAAIHFLLGEDKTIEDYHGKTETKNRIYRYLGTEKEGLINFQNDCQKLGFLDAEYKFIEGQTTEALAEKLGISEYLVCIMFAGINDYISPASTPYEFYYDQAFINDW